MLINKCNDWGNWGQRKFILGWNRFECKESETFRKKNIIPVKCLNKKIFQNKPSFKTIKKKKIPVKI